MSIQWIGLGQTPILPSHEAFRAMTAAQIDQFAAKLSAAERAELLRAGIEALPSCWGRRADSCAGAANGPYLDEAQCNAIEGGYFGNRQKMAETVDRVPLCDEQVAGSSIVPAAVLAAVIGVVLGYIVAKR